MLESLVDILTLIVQLDIALISVSIAAYAIAVSFFGREIRKIMWAVETRKKQVQNFRKIAKEKEQLADLRITEEELEQVEKRERQLRGQYRWLTFWRSIVLSLTLFLGSLILSTLEISFYEVFSTQMQGVILTLAILFTSLGLASVLKTLSAIQFLGFQYPQPVLRIGFPTGTTIRRVGSRRINAGKKQEIDFTVCNFGEDIAEMLVLHFYFHPDFEVLQETNYDVVKQSAQADYPQFLAAVFKHRIIHVNECYDFKIVVKAPKEDKEYRVPIRIYEKKLGYSSFELGLRVVK